MKRLVFTLFLGCMAMTAFGQTLKLPDDPQKASEAKRKFAISVDDMSVERYREAASALNWLMKNVPELYDGLYVNAYKAYEGLAEKETDPTKKAVYLDSMFTSFQLKDKLYGLTDLEINNVAFRYYKYHKEDAEKYDAALAAFKRAYEKPDELINNNLVAYMDIVRRSYIKNKNLSEEEILDIYTKINEVIDQKIAAGDDAEKLERYKEIVNQMLTSTVDVNCEFIQTKLYPQLQQNPGDINLAKKIFQLSLSAKCSDSDFFINTVEIVHKSEPTPGLASVLARRKAASKEYGAAIEYYNEAISLETDASKKAELNLSVARMYATEGDKQQARTKAQKAVELDKSVAADVYSFIGNLYMSSFEECSKKESQVDDRAIFFAAYDMFAKAGDAAGMGRAKEQFPTVGQVFEQNLEEGASIRVGCWINVSTTIRTRPTN